MENKKNFIKKPIPPEWWDFLKKLQNDRVEAKKETTQTQISLPKLMFPIINFFKANEKYYKAIVDVDIKQTGNNRGRF